MTDSKGEHDDWESAARHWHERMVNAIQRAGELERAVTRRNTRIKHLCDAVRKRKVERDEALANLGRPLVTHKTIDAAHAYAVAVHERDEALKSLENVKKSREDLYEKNKWQYIEFTDKIAMLERRLSRERKINQGLRLALRNRRMGEKASDEG